MKISLIAIAYLLLLAGCAGALNKNTCGFSMGMTGCESFNKCKTTLENQNSNFNISSILNQDSFAALVDQIADGNECAVQLGFYLFQVAHAKSEAGYMEELSISLSYSIVNSPESYLRYFPASLLERKDILASLSCGVLPEFNEDKEYVLLQINERMRSLKSVDEAELNQAKTVVTNTLKLFLKKL